MFVINIAKSIRYLPEPYLQTAIFASEVKGATFKKDIVFPMGFLWAYLYTFRKSQVAKGISEDTLDQTWQRFHREALIDTQGYFNRNINHCLEVTGRVNAKIKF